MSKLKPLADKLQAARQTLAEHLPWSPVSYVPGISLEGDRQLYAEELTRDLPAENDLRFTYADPQGRRFAVLAQRLPWDSDFFGYGVARLDGVFPLDPPYGQIEPNLEDVLEALIDHAKERGIRYLFSQVDPRDLALLRALGAHRFTLLETRLHYHFSVQIVHYVRLPDHMSEQSSRFRPAREEDIPSLAAVAREATNPYDRFHADPFITSDQVARLMTIWVEESVRGRFADLTIVPDVDEPRAFITYRLHRESWDRWNMHLVQPVLSAVAPECYGWFAGVGPQINQHLRELGGHHAFGKTQIVLGLDATVHLGKGEHVFRLLL